MTNQETAVSREADPRHELVQQAIDRARKTANDPIGCRRDSVGMVDLTAADLRIVLACLDAAEARATRQQASPGEGVDIDAVTGCADDQGLFAQPDMDRHSPHSTVIEDDDPYGFMSVEVLRGQNIYIWQGDSQITMGREQAEQLAASLKPAPDRGAIEAAIATADANFSYSFNLTSLVDGVATHTLTMDGFEPIDFEDREDGYQVIAERRNRLRTDAILSAIRALPALAQGEES